jgi:hypothetical protein
VLCGKYKHHVGNTSIPRKWCIVARGLLNIEWKHKYIDNGANIVRSIVLSKLRGYPVVRVYFIINLKYRCSSSNISWLLQSVCTFIENLSFHRAHQNCERKKKCASRDVQFTNCGQESNMKSLQCDNRTWWKGIVCGFHNAD